MWIAHYGENKKVIIGEMVDDKAVELASSMLTETFIYSVSHIPARVALDRGKQ